MLKRPRAVTSDISAYRTFDEIDGEHPLQSQVEDFCVLYNVRQRPGGQVAYFNFELAEEMGLIPEGHPHKLNKRLEAKLLETFGLTIINEYDLRHRAKELKKYTIRPKKFMATRYLQLQHPGRLGQTSGDGRSIWNGCFHGAGGTWDISSCGTGATCLSPATVLSNKFFRSGDPSVSYGCGRADLLDGISSVLMSEVFHGNGLATERVLCVIQYQGQSAINVRTSKNLLRPGHLFRYLKQGRLRELRQIAHYYIDRQVANGEWPAPAGGGERYDELLDQITRLFASTSALFEAEYIFCWLDWDGDNILMDGGIIDYGSVRQFGLYHHEYRYDDVDRMSTTMTEQKHKAKYTVKTFAQLVDFLKTGKKRNLKTFDHHPCLKQFDRIFKQVKVDIILKKVGFDSAQREYLRQHRRKLVEDFLRPYSYFESYKSCVGLLKTDDGVTCNAVFCMRDLLRRYPRQLPAEEGGMLPWEDFLSLFTSSYANDRDLTKTSYKLQQARQWQRAYRQLAEQVAHKFSLPLPQLYGAMAERAGRYNRYARITGDSVIHVAKEFIRYRGKISFGHYTALLEEFIRQQVVERPEEVKNRQHEKFLDKIVQITIDYREGL